MKSILLDSHIFLWAITSDPQLSKSAERLIETTANVYVSALSFFELKMKQARGKLKLPDNLEQLAVAQGFRILDFTPEQLTAYHIYHAANTDPFDNALLSIAEAQRLHLVTVDHKIAELTSNINWIIDGRK